MQYNRIVLSCACVDNRTFRQKYVIDDKTFTVTAIVLKNGVRYDRNVTDLLLLIWLVNLFVH